MKEICVSLILELHDDADTDEVIENLEWTVNHPLVQDAYIKYEHDIANYEDVSQRVH